MHWLSLKENLYIYKKAEINIGLFTQMFIILIVFD